MTTPPLSLEQWLSYVLALPSHRSSNDGHREFGARIVKLVYDEMPAQFAEDATARSYFNHMLAEVAWAVRGFSAVRDHFQRQVQAHSAHTEHARERAPSRELMWFYDSASEAAESAEKRNAPGSQEIAFHEAGLSYRR